MGIFKINEKEWNAYFPPQFKYATLCQISSTLLNINRTIHSINERIDRVDRISRINHTDQSKAIEQMYSMESMNIFTDGMEVYGRIVFHENLLKI